MELTSEDFELLLCEFCRQDLPPHFNVEHNIKDIGGESGYKRQIDTKIRGRLGVSDILICGEAKNWSEKVGIETIDGLVGKYLTGEIRANKVIIFSIQGFTKPAITRAKNLGIELLEPLKLGDPIRFIPHIIGIGYLGQMMVKLTSGNPQQNLMAVNIDDYVIIKGAEKITFQQNVFRNIVSILQNYNDLTINTEISKVKFIDHNVTYELVHKEGYRYYADFDIETSIIWDYFSENLRTGILFHHNSMEEKYVNLQGDTENIFKQVLLSETKYNYNDKQELIKSIVDNNLIYRFNLCMTDPDKNKTDPKNPRIELIK